MKSLIILACAVCAFGWVTEMENEGVYQGDMVLTPDQEQQAKEGKLSYTSIKSGLWPKSSDGKVWIPWQWDSHLSRSRKAQQAIERSIQDYHKFTCIRFKRRSGERAYIHFQTGGGCSSPVGKTGGQNTVTLADGCLAKSTVIHEIGHSIGLFHEQSRPDRDNHLKILWNNISSRMRFNFNKQSTSRVTSHGTEYDYRSVMHYGKTAFGGGKVTMDVINPYYKDLIGVGAGFSDLDIVQINRMYGCPTYNGVVEPVKQTPQCHDSSSYCEMMWLDANRRCSSYLSRRCPFTCKKCTPGGGGVKPNPNCVDKNTNCPSWKSYCNSNDYVKANCNKSCGRC